MSAEPLDRQGLDPDEIASHAFTKTRKGYEIDEVRAYLVALASKLRETLQQHSDLSRRLTEVERRAADPRDLDEVAVTEMLGEETARLLVDARKAAAEIRQRAEAEGGAAVAEADATALATRDAADQYAAGVRNLADEAEARVRAEADEYASSTREAADTETAAQRTEAETYATNLRSEVDAEMNELRSTGTAEVEAMRAEASSVLADRSAEAETAAKAIRDDADAYVTRVRDEADSYAEATRTAADSYRTDTQASADSYREEAQAEGDRLKAEAEEQAARVRGEIEVEQEAAAAANEAAADEALAEAREAGRKMVEEAKEYRERVIADLADRRRAARSQLERLASVRDALAVTLTDVVTSVELSHKTVLDTSLDVGEVGDLSVDRQALESADEIETEVDDESVDGEEAWDEESADGDHGSPESPDSSDSQESVDSQDSADSPDSDDSDDDSPPMVEPAERSGAVSKSSGPSDSEPDADTNDIDGLFARIRADATDPESAEGEPAEDEGADDEAAEDAVDEKLTDEAEADDEPEDEDEGDGEEAEGEGVEPDQELLDLRDATTDEIERQLARRLKRVMSDEQNEALDLLRRTRGTPDPAEVLPSEDDHLERYREAVLEELSAAERAGAGFYGDAPRRKADVGDVAGDFAAEMMRRVRNPLEKSFEAGDEQEVEDRIRTLYREWKTQRIADVARHYVVVAFSRGVAEAAPDGTEFRWLVDHGGDAAPDCDDNALAGPVAKGSEFPTGDLCPPAHPGCRCLAVQVD